MRSQGVGTRADFDEQKKEATKYFDGQLKYNLNPTTTRAISWATTPTT